MTMTNNHYLSKIKKTDFNFLFLFSNILNPGANLQNLNCATKMSETLFCPSEAKIEDGQKYGQHYQSALHSLAKI